MFISSETKAAIGKGQRSCSDFPCSIHFHCRLAETVWLIKKVKHMHVYVVVVGISTD